MAVAYKDSIGSVGADGKGTVTHTYTYTDCAGETYDWLFIYTVKDNIKPTYTKPANYTAYKDADCQVDVSATAEKAGYPTEVADNCTAAPTVSYRDEEPVADCVGSYHFNRVWRVVDAGGNVSVSDSIQLITVKDTTAPVFAANKSWPQNITGQNNCKANADKSELLTETSAAALFTDNCGGTVTATYEESTTGNDCSWTVTRTYTIKDPCNNIYYADPSTETLPTMT